MLSRIGASSTARCSSNTLARSFRAPLRPLTSSAFSVRPFATAAVASTPASTASTPAPAHKPAPLYVSKPVSSFSDIVKEYGGWYPFLGSAAVIAITKEIFVLDEEALMITNAVVAFLGLYVATSDIVTQAYEDDLKERREKDLKISELAITWAKAYIPTTFVHEATRDMYAALKSTYNTNIRNIAQTQNTKARYAAAQAVLKRLSDIRAREAAARGAAAAAVISGASAFVRGKVAQLSDKDKSQILENALDLLSGKTKDIPVDRDPIKKLYLDYIKQSAK